MIRTWYDAIAGSTLSMVGTFVFLGIFLMVLAYVMFAMRDKKAVDRMASLPLADDTTSNTPGGELQ